MTLTLYLRNTEQVITTYQNIDQIILNKDGSVLFTRRIEGSYNNSRTETMNIQPSDNHIVIDRAHDDA